MPNKKSFLEDDYEVKSVDQEYKTSKVVAQKAESSPDKEVKVHGKEYEKNSFLLKTYGVKLFNSVWYGSEVRSRAGGMTHNMKSNVSEWDSESVDDTTIQKLLDLFSEPGDIILDPFAGYLNSSKVIYSSGRKLIANDINLAYIEKSRADYNKYTGLFTDTPEPTFLIGDADKSIEKIATESVDMVLTVLPTKERHLLGNYPYNLPKIMDEIHRVLKTDKIATFIFRDESKGFKETLSSLDVIVGTVKSKFNLQFINVLVLDDPEDETNGIENGSIALQWHKMFYKNHYYIVGVEKL